MAEFKGTLEPWEFVVCDDGYAMVCTEGDIIAEAPRLHQPSEAIDQANFRLIAAAPALLEALKACRVELKVVNDGSVGGVPNSVVALIPEAIEKADAAIASALGEV